MVQKDVKQNFVELLGAVPPMKEFVYWEALQERKIIINEDISDNLIELAVMQIDKFNDEDKDINVNERKPIKIYVNSYGGSVYDGWSLISAIITSKTPVYTYNLGYVMSMAFAIFIAGHKRFAYKYSTYMYHELSSMAVGKAEEIKRASVEYERLQKMYDNFITERTQLPQRKLNSVKKEASDWYFGIEEAFKYEIVTDIIE